MTKIEAKFTRAPYSKAGQDFLDDAKNSWFCISSNWIEKETRHLSRGRWFRIQSDRGTIFRVLRFSPNLTGKRNGYEGEIIVDWDGWLRLCGTYPEMEKPQKLAICKSQPWEYFFRPFTHPDPVMRWTATLAIWSLFLGLVSVVLAVLALR